MNHAVIITCALTGAGDTVGRSPHVPVTPEQIARDAVEAAGARVPPSYTSTSAIPSPVPPPAIRGCTARSSSGSRRPAPTSSST